MATEEIESEVTGKVWKIEMKEGDSVREEDVIMILESMKMEIPVEAPCDGTIASILVKEEDTVEEDQVIVILET